MESKSKQPNIWKKQSRAEKHIESSLELTHMESYRELSITYGKQLLAHDHIWKVIAICPSYLESKHKQYIIYGKQPSAADHIWKATASRRSHMERNHELKITHGKQLLADHTWKAVVSWQLQTESKPKQSVTYRKQRPAVDHIWKVSASSRSHTQQMKSNHELKIRYGKQL